MYYCLNENCLLRGWDKLPTGIVRRLSGQVVFLEPDLYTKLRDFGWMLFESSPFLTDMQSKALAMMAENGFLDLCPSCRPLSEDQAYRLYPNRFLRAVHWAVTGRCNCRCRHCYMSAPSGHAGDYSHEECLRIIDQMEAAGIQSVSLTGGEALIRRDFLELAERLTRAGIRIETIMSNGLLVDEDLLTRLTELGQKPEFNMSFDGIGCHDWLRGVDGVEKKVLSAFALCAEHGFPTGSEYCLHKGNMAAFRESVKLLSSLGCGSLKVNGLSLEGEALQIRDTAITLDEEYRFYLDYIPQFYEDGEPLHLMLSGMFRSLGKGRASIPFEKMPEDRDCGNYCLCGHARNQMYLSQDGYIVPCIPIGSVEKGRNRFPSIRDMTLSEALQDSFYMSFIDTRLNAYFDMHPECKACEYRNRCAGGCRGNAAETGELMARDQKTCVFFRNGWYNRVKELLQKLLPDSTSEREQQV